MRGPIIKLAAVATAAALVLAACGEDGDDASSAAVEEEPAAAAEGPGTIVDVATEAGSFTTLLAAAQAAGLVETLSGDEPLTVFAPTDDAFAAALEALGLTADQLLADTDTLTSILTYHVVPGAVPASEVVTLDGQSVTTVNGAGLLITIDGDTVMVDDATVISPDVEASNGIIHVIDSVLLPPSDEMAADEMSEEPMEETGMEGPGTIVDVATEAGSFTTLLAAAQAAGLVETLSGDEPLTVFAPTDDAFAAALEALGLTADQLLADTDTLTSILTYHVLEGEVDAATAISLAGQSAPTVNGAEIAISYVDGQVMVDDATVITPDVEASNGIIHVIDGVLLPNG